MSAQPQDLPSPTVLDTALSLLDAGISVLPIRPGTEKRPALKWKHLQSERMGKAEARRWFEHGQHGLGLIGGEVSGGLELTEVEGRAAHRLDDIRTAMADNGLAALLAKLEGGWVERSPSGGVHWLYRVQGGVPGNERIARNAAKEVLAETRGEGGYVVVAPTPGAFHASGVPWVSLGGDHTAVVTITHEQRFAFHAVLRLVLDETPPAQVAPTKAAPRARANHHGTLSPGDDYEQRTDWADILTPHGWAKVQTGPDGTTYWRRPGKTEGISATTGHAEDRDRLYVFTSSTDFDQEVPYTKFGAYTLLEHEGKHSAAASALKRDGYGGSAPTLAPVVQLSNPLVYAEPDTGEEGESVGAARSWPILAPAAFQGLAGDIAKGLEPTTEADPAAILAQVLAAFGWLVGNKVNAGHLMIGNEVHGPRVWPVIVGDTSTGAKGTSWAAAWRPVKAHLPAEMGAPIQANGLSSGEGLIEAVRDDIGDPSDEKGFVPGVDDKRLLVKETELASVFHRMRREGNTLGPTLRQMWDGGDQHTMTRKPISATNPHVVIVGHISRGELRAVVDNNDINGGTLNRFLFFASRRSKRLPHGGNAPEDLVRDLAAQIGQALKEARTAGELNMSTEGRELWQHMYVHLTADRPETVLTKITGRRAPQVMRLALIYALMDRCKTIDVRHLHAAAALEQYSVDTAAFVFTEAAETEAQREQTELAAFIEESGPQGRTRTEVSQRFFKGNADAKTITVRLRELIEAGLIRETKGRPRIYTYTNLRIYEK